MPRKKSEREEEAGLDERDLLPPREEPDDELSDSDEVDEGGETELTELLGFVLGDEEYALDILDIKEIIRLQEITAVPRTPEYLSGIITLRGVIVPVFDLRRRLGLKESEHSSSTRIIVVYMGGEFAGFIVDAITQVMRIKADRIEPPPTTIDVVQAEFIKGVTVHQDRLVIMLNLPRVLDVKS